MGLVLSAFAKHEECTTKPGDGTPEEYTLVVSENYGVPMRPIRELPRPI